MSQAKQYTVEGIRELRLSISAAKMADLYRDMRLPELAQKAILAGKSHRTNAIDLFHESTRQIEAPEVSS